MALDKQELLMELEEIYRGTTNPDVRKGIAIAQRVISTAKDVNEDDGK